MNRSTSCRASMIMIGTILTVMFLIGGTIRLMTPVRRSPAEQFQAGLDALARSDRSAILDAVESLDAFPDYREHVHLLRAAYALRGHSVESAFRELTKLQPQGELREPALMLSGEAYYQSGKLGEARRLFATLAEEHPGHADAHRWLAAIAYDLGAFDDAMKELDIVILREPTDYRPHILKAHMLSDMERYSAAQQSYSHAVAIQPPETVLAELLPSLARVQLKQRNYADALETLAHAKISVEVLMLKGECKRGMGRPDEARQLVEEAIRRNPMSAEALALSGRLYLDAGNPELALAPLRNALEQDVHDYESRYQLAQALQELGQIKNADEQTKLWKRSIELRNELAKQTELAIQNVHDVDARDRIAELCDELGKHKLAKTWRAAAANCR